MFNLNPRHQLGLRSSLIKPPRHLHPNTTVQTQQNMSKVYDEIRPFGALTPHLFSAAEICLCKKLQSPVACRPGTGTGTLLISTGRH